MPTDPTLELERELFATGARLVIGIDEVGRGAVAGPVAVGVAVIGVPSEFPLGLRDSKALSASRREKLLAPIGDWVSAIAVGESTAAEIDLVGIVPALATAAARALGQLVESGVNLDGATAILDGSHNWLGAAVPPGLAVVVRPKADRDCAVVAAASVWAKVHRDNLMVEATDPGYGWASNKGYGSAGHFDAIRELGPSALHRVTWLSSVLSPDVAE